jgi:prepilin-type N-terminal cleavage/methylation domain-containing protein
VKRKKGFTLIEVIVSASLAAFISVIGITCTAKYLSLYKEENTQSRETFYVDEAMNFIEYKTKQGKSVQVDKNKILIELSSGIYNNIKMNGTGSGSIVIWYDSGGTGNYNNILKNVSAFECESQGDLIFIDIKTLKGNDYKRCISIVNEE